MGTNVLVHPLENMHDPKTILYLLHANEINIDELIMGPLGIGSSVDQLMEIFGLSVATSIAEVYKPDDYSQVLIICGLEKSGGDGIVATCYLYNFGYMPFVCYPKWTNKHLYYGLIFQLEALVVPFLSREE